MTDRMAKVNALVVSIVGPALEQAATGPGVLPTVTRADTTSDLRETTVWISVIPDSTEAWEQVSDSLPALQAALAARSTMKRTPKIQLRQDHGMADQQRIEELLRRGD